MHKLTLVSEENAPAFPLRGGRPHKLGPKPSPEAIATFPPYLESLAGPGARLPTPQAHLLRPMGAAPRPSGPGAAGLGPGLIRANCIEQLDTLARDRCGCRRPVQFGKKRPKLFPILASKKGELSYSVTTGSVKVIFGLQKGLEAARQGRMFRLPSILGLSANNRSVRRIKAASSCSFARI